MNKRFGIHVESMCRTNILGDEFELPYSEELEQAVLTINKICGEEVQRRAKTQADNILLDYVDKIITKENKPTIKTILIDFYNEMYQLEKEYEQKR